MTAVGDKFSFLPWVKNTLTRKTSLPTGVSASLRPVVPVTLRLDVAGDGLPTQDVTREIAVHGPGDVIGLQPEAVLKTTPPAGEQQYPASLLVSIEFGEEDLPWRYSPESIGSDPAQNAKVNPWCVLVVLEESEFDVLGQGSAPLPGIRIHDQAVAFPEVATRWAWAHVQATTQVGTATGQMLDADVDLFLDTDLKANPDLAFARIVCSRHLKPTTAYHAFLVPAYELGRLAGLGLPVPSNLTQSQVNTLRTQCAWEIPASPPARDFPVYYQWTFRSGVAEDFETLARRLQPSVPIDFGKQPLQVTTPLSSADAATTVGHQYVLDLPGILQEAGAPPMRPIAALAQGLYQSLYPQPPTTPRKRPLVTPPTYGRTYVDTTHLADPATTPPPPSTWLAQLNLHPGYRGMASIGGQVIQDNQEEYMQRAWEQVRDIIAANANLRGMQSGLESTSSMRSQHLPVTGGGSTIAARAAVSGADAPAPIESASTFPSAASPADSKAAAANGEISAAPDEQPTDEQPMDEAAATDAKPNAPLPGEEQGLENYGLHLAGMSLNRLVDRASGLTLQETIRGSDVPLAAFSPTFRRLLKPFGRYQAAQAGRPARPTQIPAAYPSGPSVEAVSLREHNTSLRQRDALLSLLTQGTITAAAPKSPYLLGFQFDDKKVDTLLANVKAVEEFWIIENGVRKKVNEGETLARFRDAYASFSQVQFSRPTSKPVPLSLAALKEAVITGTDPGPVFLARANRAIRFLPHYGNSPNFSLTPNNALARSSAQASATGLQQVKPIMAYPVFKEPMGPVLQRRRPELFLPNLDAFPPNAVTLLEYNHAFIEAYLVGLNHAFGSELIWRNYPTDLRGSYFRQFWDVTEYRHLNPPVPATPEALAAQEEGCRDVPPLDQWATGAQLRELGDNKQLYQGQAVNSPLLLAVRGELLLRYPNTVVCAAPAVTTGADNHLVPDLGRVRYPLHRSTLGQDILLFSFDLAIATARGLGVAPDLGWFFVLHERPGEPQFGLDSSPGQSDTSWDDFAWPSTIPAGGHLNSAFLNATKPSFQPFTAISDSAKFAYATFQQPFLVAMHAQDLLRPTSA